MDKIIILTLALLISVVGMSSAGCTTTPPPNITIGGSEWCPPASVTINVVNGTDKAIVGEGDINDDDAGLTEPTLGL